MLLFQILWGRQSERDGRISRNDQREKRRWQRVAERTNWVGEMETQRRYFRSGVGVKTSLCGWWLSLDPSACGIGCWTGSGWDVSLQAAVGLEIEDIEWIGGSSWCVPVMLSGWTPVKMKRPLNLRMSDVLCYLAWWKPSLSFSRPPHLSWKYLKVCGY